MALISTCPCGQRFQVRDEDAGKRVRCPACHSPFVAPPPPPAPVPVIVPTEGPSGYAAPGGERAPF